MQVIPVELEDSTCLYPHLSIPQTGQVVFAVRSFKYLLSLLLAWSFAQLFIHSFVSLLKCYLSVMFFLITCSKHVSSLSLSIILVSFIFSLGPIVPQYYFYIYFYIYNNRKYMYTAWRHWTKTIHFCMRLGQPT